MKLTQNVATQLSPIELPSKKIDISKFFHYALSGVLLIVKLASRRIV